MVIDMSKENSLAVKCPELIREWNIEKNGDLTPHDVTTGSNRKVWWICNRGHEWLAVVGSRVRGNGCPYCSNQLVLKGYNDLCTTHPELINEWDWDKNILDPSQVLAGSKRMAWWKCSLGHSYDMRISTRSSQKCGCPYCSIPAKRVLKGFNDLQTRYPELAKEWHPSKNGELTPDSVLCGSARKVWWIGICGHEFNQSIANRVHGGNCPYCSHQKLLKGYNDFATTHPSLLNEWDYDKNTFLPSQIGVGSHRKVWWKCPFGHSYQAYPSNRCGISHSGCPICDKENHTSFPEQALLYYIQKYYPDAENSNRTAIGMELDIYIPSLRIAIEYDGANWHKDNFLELKKNRTCQEMNIQLIRIREKGLELYDDCFCILREDNKSELSLSYVIRQVLKAINKTITMDVDVRRDSAVIYSSYILTRKKKSLKSLYPDIASEWHPSKNGDLTSEMVAPKTEKKVWWLGQCGHEWLMAVQQRTYQNCGCPICAGKRILSGTNDLLSKYPSICEEWDYKKNAEEGLFPNKVAPHSDKKAWWICKRCGKSWKSKIDGRTRMNAGCPYCKNYKISVSKYKKVKCIETGVVYESIIAAAQHTGVNKQCISNCCRGVQYKAGGLHWKFV